MKRIIIFIFLSIVLNLSYAQDDITALRDNARTLLQQGNYDNALQLLEKARQLQPDNIDVLKDEILAYYYKRDYAKALEVSKPLAERDDADVQSYQLLGMTYKAIASYKDADKMYKTAFKKFPNSGVLYSEYGDMLASSNNTSAAIKQWEKGIEIDPNISSNYYYASKFYAKNGNIIWGLLYGEVFINLESLTKRTTEIREQLLNGYKKLFANKNNISSLKADNSAFTNAVVETLGKMTSVLKDNPTPEALTALRTRFVLDWYANNNERNYRFKLFDFQRQLLQEGYFDAYNQWLFGETENTDKYNNWVYTHNEEAEAFKQFKRTSLLKIPAGQYYEH